MGRGGEIYYADPHDDQEFSNSYVFGRLCGSQVLMENR